MRALIAEPFAAGNQILVTHQVDITALTGGVPAPGETVVVAPEPQGAVNIVGRLGPGAFSEN